MSDFYRRKDYDIFKDVVCLDETGFTVNGEKKNFSDWAKSLKTYRHKKKYYIFVNNLFNLKGWKLKLYNEVQHYDEFTEQLIYSETEKAIWVDFKFFCGGLSVKEISEIFGFKGTTCQIMTEYIKYRCDNGFRFKTNQISITQYVMSKFNALFTEDDLNELKLEMNYHVLNQSTLKHLMLQNGKPNLGAKPGFYDKAQSRDISSDFAAIMVYLSNYPVGKILPCDLEKIIECVKENKWCAIVVDDETTLELYDIKRLHLNGINAFNMNITACYYCTKCDYLHKIFRDKLVDIYNKKESSSGAEKLTYKRILNTTYGYGLRRSLNEYFSKGKFLHKPSFYLTPAISGHTVAYARFYLEWMKKKFKNVVYHDTDCIKTTDENADEIFAAENERVRMAVEKAGYNCSIGQWKKESDGRLIVYGEKKYAYETSDGFVCKLAGCNKNWEQIESFDELLKLNAIKNGICLGGNKFVDYPLGGEFNG